MSDISDQIDPIHENIPSRPIIMRDDYLNGFLWGALTGRAAESVALYIAERFTKVNPETELYATLGSTVASGLLGVILVKYVKKLRLPRD